MRPYKLGNSQHPIGTISLCEILIKACTILTGQTFGAIILTTAATEECSEKPSRHDVGSRAEQDALQLEYKNELRLGAASSPNGNLKLTTCTRYFA